MKVLVTGSSGRIGSAIFVRLARTHEVLGLDRSPSSTADIVADVSDRAALRRAISGVDAVVHTAALHAPHVGHAVDEDFERVNVEGTRTVAQLCCDLGVRRLVFTSTTALYGGAATFDGEASWVSEDTVPAPRTIYHRTKLRAEALLREAASATLQVTVLRMSRCFPEPAPLMAVYRLHRGIDARDVASAHELALAPAREPFRLFIVSGRTPFAVDDAKRLKSDAPAVLRLRAPALADALARRGWPLPPSIDRVYDAALAMEQLGWTPRHGADEVLRLYDDESPDVLPPQADWQRHE